MTTAQDQQSRAEFEASMLAHMPHANFQRDDGGYESPWLQVAWTGWQAARALPATSSVSNARSGAQWKCGNEFLPYHPSASHVEPAYRDGWNACFKAAAQVLAMGRVPPGWQAAPLEATEKMIRASDAVDFTRLDTDGVTRAVYESMLAAAPRPPAAQEPK